MGRHARFDELHDTRSHTDVCHDGLVTVWREQYEEALRMGRPAPDLPREVEATVIRSGRRLRSEFIADGISRGLRWLVGLLDR